MESLTPEVVSDVMMWNQFDKTRQQNADKVNADHGTDLNKRDVGEIINHFEQKADNGNAHWVHLNVHLRGLGADMGTQMAYMLTQDTP